MEQFLMTPTENKTPDPTSTLFNEIEQIKEANGTDTRRMVRDVAALLFMRYGETPTPNRVYSLLRKGSMTTIHEAMKTFWEEIRDKADVRISAPDIPQPILDHLAAMAATAWRMSNQETNEAIGRIQKEAETNIQEIRTACDDNVMQSRRLAELAEQETESARDAAMKERADRQKADAHASELQAEIATLMEAGRQSALLLQESRQQSQALRLDAERDRQELMNQIGAMTADRQRDREMIEGLRKRSLEEVENARLDARNARQELQTARSDAERERTRAQARMDAFSKEVAGLREEISTLKQRLEGMSCREIAQKETLKQLLEDRLSLQNKVETLIQESGRLSAEAEKVPALARQIEELLSKAEPAV